MRTVKVALCRAVQRLSDNSDDLNRVDRQSIIEGVRACQNQNGSFIAMVECENDMRFLYCLYCLYCLFLMCISDFRLISHTILAILSKDHVESHGGSTFCGCGILNILAKFNNTRPDPLHTYLDKCIKLRFYSVFEFKDL
ncbi:geranylgeranyl transferase type-1 subunit beta-like isoform X2 [Pogonomyrmex barbatus]|uniref:Geranylgeranyl transferase type-1 subunit beta-like isoform X2 n=1 Tax=Pogonomyrmex barbatus TaxID=144034 RepID=A0A6I9WFV7_9HYME|nr:geranylgeranyl transferase type-1 subunit beta-like isoform X2 [Pogonomyrmex barbatus]